MRLTRIAFRLLLGIHAGVAFATQWTPAGAGLTGSTPRVTRLVIDRAAGSTLYALAGSIFRSTDGGASWKALGTISGVQVLALDPTSASTIYAGAARGVFKSTDGGDTWVDAGLSGTSIRILAIDPVTPSNLYAAGGGKNTLYRSTDSGASWTAVSISVSSHWAPFNDGLTFLDVRVLAIARGAAPTLYAGTPGGIFRIQ